MIVALLLAAAVPPAPAVRPGSYRCVGDGTDGTLILLPDYSYRWRDEHGVGTWRYDRRERVFLIATGPLALRDPRDGRYAPGRIELTLGGGERLVCRIETKAATR